MTEEWLRLWQDEIDRGEAYAQEESQRKARQEALAVAVTEVTSATIVLGKDVSTGQPVTVTAEELCSGTYLLGTQGAGKSSLLEQIVYQRMEQHDSVIVLDPHGELIDNVIARMPQTRLDDTYLLDLNDARRYPFRLNIFHCTDPHDETARAKTRGRVLRVFRRIWPEIETGQYVEKMLRHVTTTLIYNPTCTLADVPGWFRGPQAASKAVSNVQDPETQAFWLYDLPALSPRDRSFQTEPFLNRVTRLLSDDVLRRLLCSPGPPLDVGRLIRHRRSLLIKLPVAADVVGEAASLTGVALFSLIYAATFDDRPKDHRDSYTLVVDEFQNFVTSEFVKLFVGGRKHGAKLVLAHQYIDQLDLPGLVLNRSGVLTARTVVSFHTTPHDAAQVAPLFVQLEKIWARDNLVADVTEALKRHPVEVVKKFALRHVDPLIQASRMQNRGTLDFGWGHQSFDPEEARSALSQLNNLLYEAERDGQVSSTRQAAVVEAVMDAPRYLRFQEGFEETKRQFDADLSDVISALIIDPLVQHQHTGGRTVASQLPSLPSRRAFVKTGPHTYQIETYPLPQAVSQDEAEDRREDLLHQTHLEYCSPKATVDEQILNSPCRQESQGKEPPRDDNRPAYSNNPSQKVTREAVTPHKEEIKSPSINRRSPPKK
ncbi:type IV secretion system DNA-binding domain-containing protein [Streptomyces lavendulae]|uniref:type IV secretion system DNA-binding domain-containing protein n=1 Tax=Streptomyces lavendulae TaxID=1914 RepID=UPI0036EB1E48